MVCPSCGIEQPAWSKFCVSCGARLDSTGRTCPVCHAENPLEARYCHTCGRSLDLVLCLHCGVRNPAGEASCHACGAALSSRVLHAGLSPDRGTRGTRHESGESERQYVVLRMVPGVQPAESGGPPPRPSSLRTRVHDLLNDPTAITWDLEDGGVALAWPCRGDPDDAINRAVEFARAARGLLDPPVAEGQAVDSPAHVRVAVHLAELDLGETGAVPVVRTPVENEGQELIRLCPPGGGLCVSESVLRAVQPHYLDRPVGLIGRGDAPRAGAYLLGEPRPSLPSGVEPPPRLPMVVGRDREQTILQQRWDEVQRGEGSRMLTLLAQPGLGRTTVLDTFLASVDTPKATFVVTSCEEQTRLAPYYPIIDLVTQIIGATPDDDDDTVALRLMLKARDAVAAAEGWEVSRLHEPDIIELSTVIGELLGIDLASRERYLEPSVLDPESLRQRTFYCLLKFFQGLSCKTPMVLSVENLHLADSATLDLMEYLGKTLRGHGRLFVLCSGHASFEDLHPEWGQGWSRHETLRLEPVDDTEIERLVRALVPDTTAAEVVRAMVRHARGKPAIASLVAHAWLEEQQDDDVTESLSTMSDFELEPTPEGPGSDSEPDISSSRFAEALTPADAEPDTAGTPPPSVGPTGEEETTTPGPTPTPLMDQGGQDRIRNQDDPDEVVDYYFETEEQARTGLEEGSSFVMAYGDDGEPVEDETASESTVDELFAVAPDPLGPLQHLLPGEIWARRIGHIDPNAHTLLTLASISGRTVRCEQLVAQWRANDGDDATLGGLLVDLQRRGLLDRRLETRPWQVTWRFRNTLLQQVVYDSTPLAERHRLHRQFARLLEGDRVGARVRGTYALVAHHYDRGNEADRAFRYHVMAGKRARRTQALQEAERLLLRARALLKETGFPDGGTETIAIHHMLGETLGLLNEPKRAVIEFERALEFARVRQEPRVECEVMMSLCDLLDRRGDRRRALEAALEATRLARASASNRLVVRSLRRLGWEHVRAGRVDEGRKALQEAVRTALDAQDPELVTEALDALGTFYYLTGNYGLAVRSFGDLLDAIKQAIRHRGPSSSFPD